MRTSMKPPPPMPEWYMPMVPTQKTVPTSASMALPPCSSSSMPMLLQTELSEATAPSVGASSVEFRLASTTKEDVGVAKAGEEERRAARSSGPAAVAARKEEDAMA